jgi:hypothetical protein
MIWLEGRFTCVCIAFGYCIVPRCTLNVAVYATNILALPWDLHCSSYVT